jgi:hypothetical protein
VTVVTSIRPSPFYLLFIEQRTPSGDFQMTTTITQKLISLAAAAALLLPGAFATLAQAAQIVA